MCYKYISLLPKSLKRFIFENNLHPCSNKLTSLNNIKDAVQGVLDQDIYYIQNHQRPYCYDIRYNEKPIPVNSSSDLPKEFIKPKRFAFHKEAASKGRLERK